MAETNRRETFRAIFCRQYRCSEKEFPSRFFIRTIHRRTLPAIVLIRWLWPNFFKADWELIEDIGAAEHISEVMQAINNFRDDCHREQRFFHDQLRLRISGQRVSRLVERLRANDRQAGKATS